MLCSSQEFIGAAKHLIDGSKNLVASANFLLLPSVWLSNC